MGIIQGICDCSEDAELKAQAQREGYSTNQTAMLDGYESYDNTDTKSTQTSSSASPQIAKLKSSTNAKPPDAIDHTMDALSLDINLVDDDFDETGHLQIMEEGTRSSYKGSPLSLKPVDSTNTHLAHQHLTMTLQRSKSIMGVISDSDDSDSNGVSYLSDGTVGEDWNEESQHMLHRMDELLHFIENTKLSTRSYIWYSFDKQKTDRLKTKHFIPKMMYAYIVLFLKAFDKLRIPPHYRALRSLLVHYTLEVISLMPNRQKSFMSKEHFDANFLLYLDRIVDKTAEQLR